MIDSHAHLISEFYKDIDEIVSESKEKGVTKIINCSDNISSSKEVLGLSKKYKNFLFPAIGIHPQNIDNNKIEELEKLIDDKVIAIGEIGLDYNYSKENKDIQKEYFINQIDIAIKHNLPIIVHARDAIQDTYDILKSKKVRGVIHCYSGSAEMAKEFIKLGFYLGIGGVLTFKNSYLYRVIEEVGLDHILIETDSPFLSPEPYRGKNNYPGNVYYVAKKIAEIKNINIDEVVDITSKNACNLFDI